MHDVDTVYSIPVLLNKQKVDKTILRKLKVKTSNPKLNDWKRVIKAKLLPEREVNVSFVGKYTELKDSYKSINEALEHAGIKNKAQVNINFVEAENITSKNIRKTLNKNTCVFRSFINSVIRLKRIVVLDLCQSRVAHGIQRIRLYIFTLPNLEKSRIA